VGSISNKITDNNATPDEIKWYFAKCRALLEQQATQRSVENCYAGYSDMVSGLARLVEGSLSIEQALEFVPHFRRAIFILQNGKPGRLTVAHRPLLWMCVQNRLYHIVKDVVATVICECSPSLTVRDYLYYFYYAGLTHIALKQLDQALDHLAMCQIVPGDSCSMIQIDAQKKYMLVSLIVNGKVVPLPEFVPHRLAKSHAKCCRAYSELEDAFTDCQAEMEKVLGRNYETYEKDYNIGLVHQVIKAQEIARVRRLRNVYASCSVAVAATQAQIENSDRAKKIIVHLIKEGELSATIDANEVVTFKKNKSESEKRYLSFANKIAMVMDLNKKAEGMFHALRTSDQYMKNTSANMSQDGKDIAEDVSLMS